MYDEIAVKEKNCSIRADIIAEAMNGLQSEEIEVYVKQEKLMYRAAIRLAVELFAASLILLLCSSLVASAQTTQVDDGHGLVVTSFPDGAHIILDGTDTGKLTPSELHGIKVGNHVLTVSTDLVGWSTDTRTIAVLDLDGNGRVRDTHIAVSLLPSLTTGPPGPQGPPGAASTVAGPQGLPGISIVGPQGVPGLNGATGATGATGAASTVPGPSGIQGITGPSGSPGANGTNGRSPFQGIYNPSFVYDAGDEVLRPAGLGSRGPFWCVSTNCAGTDPAIDTTNWTYCCGSPSPGYSTFSTNGNYGSTLAPGSSETEIQSTLLNAIDARTFGTLTVNVPSIQASVTTTIPGATCFTDHSGNGGAPSPVCSFDFTSPSGGFALVNNNFTFNGFTYQEWQTPTTTTTVSVSPGALTWTVFKNGTATALTLSSNQQGTFTATGIVAFSAGDTIALILNNPSTFTDEVNGTWQLN